MTRLVEIALEFRHSTANLIHGVAATVIRGTIDTGADGAASSPSFPQRWACVGNSAPFRATIQRPALDRNQW